MPSSTTPRPAPPLDASYLVIDAPVMACLFALKFAFRVVRAWVRWIGSMKSGSGQPQPVGCLLVPLLVAGVVALLAAIFDWRVHPAVWVTLAGLAALAPLLVEKDEPAPEGSSGPLWDVSSWMIGPLLLALSIYADFVFPRLPQKIGGGAPQWARISLPVGNVADTALIALHTEPVQVIRVFDDSLIIRDPADRSRLVEVNRDAIDAIVWSP
jgi:hypothetical protein